MSKSTKVLIKQRIAWVLIVLMSINTFAAVVGDNDGAAFITKAEFESLKNDFQTQINRYNSSLDNKIDGAIATYLAGVAVARTSNVGIIMSSSKEYVMRNGTLNNEYQLPDANISVAFMKTQFNNGWDVYGIPYQYFREGIPRDVWDNRSNPTQSASMNVKVIHGWGNMVYTREADNVNNQRNTVLRGDDPDGVMNGTKPIIWKGCAENKHEVWNLTAVWDISNDRHQAMGNSDPAWLYDSQNNYFLFGRIFRFGSLGKLKNVTELSNPDWNPELVWYWSIGSGTWDISSSKIYYGVIPTMEYLPDDEGNVWSHENLGIWKDDTTLECELESTINYANYSTINATRSSAWFNAVSAANKSGSWSGSEYSSSVRPAEGTVEYPKPVGWKIAQNVEWADGQRLNTVENFEIPQLGLLPVTPRADGIYQFYKTLKDNNGNLVPDLKLNQGMPLCYVTLDEKVTWEPTFKTIEAKDYTTDLEAVIVLSYEPFTTKTSVTDNSNYVDIDGFTKGVTFPETTDKKVKISFTADRSGYVYAKWFPKLSSQTDIDTKEWEVVLDIDNSSTYISEK